MFIQGIKTDTVHDKNILSETVKKIGMIKEKKTVIWRGLQSGNRQRRGESKTKNGLLEEVRKDLARIKINWKKDS